MQPYIAKFFAVITLSGSLLVQAAETPFALVVGSSVIGTRENSKQDVHLGFNALFNSLLASENIQCEFKDFDKPEYLKEAIKNREVNGMFGSPLEYIQSEIWLTNAYLMSGLINNQYKSKILILVRKDSETNSIEQLKGKKIAVQRGVIQDIGGLYLETILLEKKLPAPSVYFSEIVKTDTSNVALVNLFFNKADVALMSEGEFNIAAELNPQMRKQTKVIHASEPYITFVSATSKSIPPEKMEAIKTALLNVEKSGKGRSVLKLLKVDGFKVIGLNELENVRALVEKNKQLKAFNHVK
ncbi:MAG TPA: PhnD/SsuA/transferrin family substrate-binding protein [Methylotenera sp.]|nr:PhnD/SsuA/transferrin family substrate-binding protein [Methylotenera sp.]HPH04973.1 PhnD/SsuA/transferrin family substrate-binding protein [Methylotenera sp.]HPN00235.1 PhnD/SsuA/transferrin family substrate-binding protein [Methylotenera sp.]